MFLKQQVVWLSLEELSQQTNLNPLLNLLTLPAFPEKRSATPGRYRTGWPLSVEAGQCLPAFADHAQNNVADGK